ncbi:hypothetical protein RCO48_23025 [Peribacillus frigoritolerans]|nr:hypothetical protein [Peribacillus frigoritolerans]
MWNGNDLASFSYDIMEETSDGLRRIGMASDNETIQLELVKAILEELPFGVLVTKNEKRNRSMQSRIIRGFC